MLYLIIGGCGYFLFLLIFIACPLLGKLVLLALNVIIPDPLPCIDEIVMIGSTAGSIFGTARKAISLTDFVAEHKVLAILLGITVAVVVKYCFF